MKKKIFETESHKGHTLLKLNLEKLDTQVSPQLKAEFFVICRSPMKKLVIDMSSVKSCDSSGLSALLVAERQMREIKGEVHLIIPNLDVRNLFRITQLEKVFTIHVSPETVS
ncbi:MAG: STAS domain-containing protein [Bacteroidetes bacterium]|nr:STAS domain-containing protein [Bacteroidota bacterium]